MKIYVSILMLVTGLFMNLSVTASPPMTQSHPAMPGQNHNRVHGKVVTSMDARGYTYVQIDTGSKKYWAAGPKTVLKKGSMIAIDTAMPFNNFESKELKRKFDTVYFVSRFVTDKPEQKADMADPHAGIKMPTKEVAITGIKKLKNGKTVAEVFSQKKALSGKAIRIRGKVVKYTPKVMGKNWLHIQDSSGIQKLVVTTDQEVKNGDLVVINGTVAVDQDLGYGYTYEVIVEHAKISVE